MRILVLNCGSSSLKFRLLDLGKKTEGVNRVLGNGAVKGIGGTGTLEFSAEGQAGSKISKPVSDRYCQLKPNWADFLPRASNPNAEQSMSYEFAYCLIFGQIHLT